MNKNIAESLRAAKLVNAESNLCWENAVKVMLQQEYIGATYVEGAVVSRKVRLPHEHAWIVFHAEILDPTLPEMELYYFPAHEWNGDEFLRVFFRYSDKPYFRHVEFMKDGVQVEMDKARKKAALQVGAWSET